MDRLEALRTELAREGLEIRCIAADLANPADVSRLVSEASAFPIDLLINNAGLGDHGLFEESAWERIAAMIDVNVRALTQVTHGLVKGLIQRGRAGIINVSSIASLLPVPQMTVYAAAKAYVTSFSEALRAELRGTGVRVLAVCPGPVDTEFFDIAERPGSDGSQAAPKIMKVPAPEVVRTALRALDRGRARVIPGWFVRLTMGATNLTPMFLKRLALNRRGRGFTGH